MRRDIEALISTGLARWVDGVRRRARTTVLVCLAITAVCLVHSLTHLGVNAENTDLLSPDMPSRRAHRVFTAHFPNLEAALFVVIDGDTPEQARRAAEDILAGVLADPTVFENAYLPGGGDFFERNGLLYLDLDALDDFADRMARMQPLIAELDRDPRIGHMVEVVDDGLDTLDQSPSDVDQWARVFDRLGAAARDVSRPDASPISWEEIVFEGSALPTTTRRTLIVHPIFDFDVILHAGPPMQRIWEIAEAHGHVSANGVEVRITGNPALNYEEMIGFAWDIMVAGFFCFLLVAGILVRAFGSVRLAAATLVTLLVGLVWTAEFATLALGELNVASIVFTILFIGLGVDFGIHLGIAYGSHRQVGTDHAEALRAAAASVGTTLLFCTLTTSIGFYVFVPTPYRGVAELGLIAGSGMSIIFILTMTLLPALLSSWLPIDPAQELKTPLRLESQRLARLAARPRWIVGVATCGALASLFVLPDVSFDTNVVLLRDPDAQSVRAFEDIVNTSDTSPWYLNVLMPDLASADRLARDVEALPEVDFALTISGFVPDDQDEKIDLLADVAFLFDPTGGSANGPGALEPIEAEQTLAALAALGDRLRAADMTRADATFEDARVRLANALDAFVAQARAEADPATLLARLERLVLHTFPEQLERLRRALEPSPIGLASLPRDIATRMVTAAGVHRVQIFPAVDLTREGGVETFVQAVEGATPNLAGVPLNLIDLGRVTRESFMQALLSAIALIALLVFFLWRSVGDVALVMFPLALGASLTGATLISLGYALNFANVLVIPLLFGVGVDSAIHIVQQNKHGTPADALLTGSPTARAIFFSALTTIVSFGSLIFAAHRGMASLGAMLTIGLAYTLVAVLLVLPALIRLRGDASAPRVSAS